MSTHQEFQEKGFTILRKLFSKEEVGQVKRDALSLFTLHLKEKNLWTSYDEPEMEKALYRFFREHQTCFINCGKHSQYLVSLFRLSADPRIIGSAAYLGKMKFPNIATKPVLYFNSRHLATKEIYYKVPSHQDAASMDCSSNAVVAWLPLSKITPELGPLEVVPGSHREGLLTSRVEESFGLVDKYSDPDFQAIDAEVGDVVFFSAYLVHRSGNNTSESIRWSSHFRIQDLEDPDFIKRGSPHPYIYKPIFKKD